LSIKGLTLRGDGPFFGKIHVPLPLSVSVVCHEIMDASRLATPPRPMRAAAGGSFF
jgi:hypothetical protein